MFVEFIRGSTAFTMDYAEICDMYIDTNGVDWITVRKDTLIIKKRE